MIHTFRCFVISRILPVFLILAAPGAATGTLVINEFLPDPEGSDGGKEFVEIFNPGPDCSLDGLRLEFANGATGATWETRWTAPPGLILGGGDRFLICDRNWTEDVTPDAEVYLGLQNGPDAIRLTLNGVVLDLVGYGPLTDPLLFEGTPVLLQSGASLARRPDGVDRGDNAADFVIAAPTPGAPNFRDWDFQVQTFTGDPPCLDRPERSLRINFELENRGLFAWPGGAVQLDFAGRIVPAFLDGLPSGETRTLLFVVQPPRSGDLEVVLRLPLPGHPDTLRIPICRYRVGLGDLVINEVQPAPDQGQGEYVELANLSGIPLNLRSYSLKDEDGPWRPLPAGLLDPGELAVVAQDSAALTDWIQANGFQGTENCAGSQALSRLLAVRTWPSLNNSIPDGRTFADRICLGDSSGMAIDQLTFGGPDAWSADVPPSGQSLERLNFGMPLDVRASTWATSPAWSGGTPGCPNSIDPVIAGEGFLTVQPRVLDPSRGQASLSILLDIHAPGEGFQLAVYDLEGRRIRNLGGDLAGPGLRTRHWNGENDHSRLVRPGGYIVLASSLGGAGAVLEAARALVVVR